MSFSAGDHLKIQCVGYTHHGLYVGNGMVIHKNKKESNFPRKKNSLKVQASELSSI